MNEQNLRPFDISKLRLQQPSEIYEAIVGKNGELQVLDDQGAFKDKKVKLACTKVDHYPEGSKIKFDYFQMSAETIDILIVVKILNE